MKLSELTKQVIQEFVSPEVHAANKKVGLKISQQELSEVKTTTLDPRKHEQADYEHDLDKDMLKDSSPGLLHRVIQHIGSKNQPNTKIDDIARDHLQNLKSKKINCFPFQATL